MNQQQPLHPNLARIAAVYDEIVTRFSRGEINAADARGQILALMARDDNGTMWSIDPDTAQWRYQTRGGKMEFAEPPTVGLATPTAFDLTKQSAAFNPDSRISFYEVDEQLLHPPTSLVGSTRRPDAKSKRPGVFGLVDEHLSTPARRVAAAAVAVLVLFAGVSAVSGEEPPVPAPAEAPAPAPAAPQG